MQRLVEMRVENEYIYNKFKPKHYVVYHCIIIVHPNTRK